MPWVNWLKTRELVTARPDESVASAVERMVERHVGSVLIVEGKKLRGIFSERDAMTRVLSAGKDPATTPLADVMTAEPKVVRFDAPLAECTALVKRYGVRHVPVVDHDDVPVGIISVRDFLHFVLDELETLIERAYREKRLEQLTDPYAAVAESDRA